MNAREGLIECVNCGRIYPADKLPKCPACSASSPIEYYLGEQERRKQEERSKVHKPSVAATLGSTILWYAGVAFVVFIIVGFLTDGYGSGGGNVPGKECVNYEMPNGDWANSCDQ